MQTRLMKEQAKQVWPSDHASKGCIIRALPWFVITYYLAVMQSAAEIMTTQARIGKFERRFWPRSFRSISSLASVAIFESERTSRLLSFVTVIQLFECSSVRGLLNIKFQKDIFAIARTFDCLPINIQLTTTYGVVRS